MSNKETELAALKGRAKQDSEDRISKESGDRLKKIAGVKFRTCFIAALSEFESTFGQNVWGHGLSEDELTTEQKTNRDMWLQVRKKILDKGNAQLRALCMEIDLHRVDFQGYKMAIRREKRYEG